MNQVLEQFLHSKTQVESELYRRLKQPENYVSGEYFAETLDFAKLVTGVQNLELGKAAGRYSKTVEGWLLGQLPSKPSEIYSCLALVAKKIGRELPAATLEGELEVTKGNLDTPELAAGSGGE